MASATSRPASTTGSTVLIMVVIFVAAFAARLVPWLRGGGLTGLGSYDDSVYYAAAASLAHGQLLYRDVLFLQPPGIAILLLPFAFIGRLVGDPTALGLARSAFMIVGSLTAVLVARLVRPLGAVPATVAGLAYALYLPAAYVDRITVLEGPGNTLVIITLLLVSRSRSRRSRPELLLVLAGVALGLSVSIKIWALAAALVIIGWLWVTRSWRPAARVLLAATTTGTAIALPFLLSAPREVWQMVVTDQLGRRRTGSEAERLTRLAGLSRWDPESWPTAVLLVVVVALGVAVALAFTVARLRLAALIFVVDGLVLLAAPSTFLHYAALVAVPGALVLGAATARMQSLVTGWAPGRRGPRVVVGALVIAGLLVCAAPLTQERFGRRFPVAALAPVAAAVPGCVTADEPSTLIQLGVLGRNLDRGCPAVVDLGGASYHSPLRGSGQRRTNADWQPYALDFLRRGDLVIITRFRSGFGFDAETAQVVRGWPVVAREGPFRLRRPS